MDDKRNSNNNENFTKESLEKKIVLITGPMFAGKSNKVIEFAEKFDSVEAFKPAIHTRDGEKIKSRTGKEIPCHLVEDIRDVKKSKTQAVVIDEFQFIDKKQLIDILEYFKKEKKTLIIAGLRKKDRLEYWPNYKLLKEKSDILIKLKARCEVCGEHARYTYTNHQWTPRAIIRKIKFGTLREPRCEKCYNSTLYF